MDRPGRGETAGLCERARAFIGNCAPWSIKISPQEVEEPVPRAVGGERFESREAGRAGTPSITVPSAVSAASPPATPASELEVLQKYLPKGSVYLWAAMVDGAAATDAIAGWIVLMAQISCYILILVNSPQRGIEQLQEDSIVHVLIEDDHTSDYTLEQSISDDATTIKVDHSTESVSYALSSISAAVYLVLTFAAGDLRAAFALLQTRKLYNMILGAAILASFVLLVLASLSILFFLANDNASFVVGAAAVLFISDLDEKLWTALQTITTRSRLFWCIEAFAVSLVLANAGIAWFGNTVATSADGVDAKAKDTEYYTSLLFFETGFVFLVAPIGATVGAWGIALFLQYLAERYTRTDAVRPRNLGNFIFLNAFVTGHVSWILFAIVAVLSPLKNVLLLAAPLVLSVAAGVAMCFPYCTKFLSRGRLKMLVGIGVGYFISVSHATLLLLRYEHGFGVQLSVEGYVLVVTFTAALSLFLAVSLVKAIGQSFDSYPADMRALTWRLICCGTTDSTANRDDEADPTVFGTALVIWSLYACVFFVIVLALTVHVGSVMF